MTFQTRKTNAGFTLIELMIAISVAAILCAVSFPALGGLVHSAQSRGSHEAMFSSLALARNTAVTRQSEIVLCASRDGEHCDGGQWWQDGWIVFQDSDRDGTRDANESVIQVVQAQRGVTIETSAERTHITFRSDGTSPGTNATFTFCDIKPNHATGSIVVSNAGRARQGNATADQDAICARSNPNA